MGLSAGITQLSLNANKLNFGTVYAVDPAVGSSGVINRIKPDISAGIWLYSRNYFIGLAFQQIITEQIAFSNKAVVLQKGKLVPHVFLTAGYREQLSEDVGFLPSVLIRYVNPLPTGFDINAKFQYQDLVWAGVSYRYQESFAGMVRINISNAINISYSYDATTSQLNTVSRGTHEILIGFLIGNGYGGWCSRNLW